MPLIETELSKLKENETIVLEMTNGSLNLCKFRSIYSKYKILTGKNDLIIIDEINKIYRQEVIKSDSIEPYSIELTLNVEPKAKQSFRVSEKVKYQDPKIVQLTNLLQWEIKKQLPKGFKLIDAPVHIDYEFHYYQKTKINKINKVGLMLKDTRPDSDNLQKFINDVLNKIVINDDAQICTLTSAKYLSTKNCIKLKITVLDSKAEIIKKPL